MRKLRYLLILSCLLFTLPSALSRPPKRHQSVGLVLSGGGAKGIAHIGAIKALEENDIPIDFITGTSMGAIVGSLYAIGYTPEEMMELICSPYFAYMSTGKIDPEYTYYLTSPTQTPQLFSFQLGRQTEEQKDLFNPQSLISPSPMQFGFMQIYSASTAQCRGDFDKLMVPFRCVGSNMTKLHKHVFAKGDLAQAVRASMSFPLVFQALKINGDLFYDGGLFDNFPVDVMHSEFDPTVMIGFDVSSTLSGPPNSLMDQLDLLVSRPQSYDLPDEYGIKVRINLNEFSLLDFPAAKRIYEIGYRRTLEMMDSIKARVYTRTPSSVRQLRRNAYRAATPELRFANVTVTGASKQQNEYLQYLFGHEGDTISIDKARLAFYHALASEKLNKFEPTASPIDSSGLFNLNIKASIKRKYELGVGAFITSSNNSFLYARLGYSSLSFSSVSTNLEAWIGQSYLAGAFTGTISIPSAHPSLFRFEAVASHRRFQESEKLFFRDNEPTFVINNEYFGKIAYSIATGRRAAMDFGLGGGRLYNSFYRNSNPDSYISGRDNIAHNLGQAFIGYNASTIDDELYPTEGYRRLGYFSGVMGKSHFYSATAPEADARNSKTEEWLQLHWRERDYFNLGQHWSLGVEAEMMASTRHLLQSYYATITSAPGFIPTSAANNVFDPGLRANSFGAISLVPVYKYNTSLSARLSASVFMPARAIIEQNDGSARYGKWFGQTQFFGEFNVAYRLAFATVAAYCNYSTSRHHFNAGISLGMYLTAPKFLK